MKTAIFTWLLFLPLQIYAASFISSFSNGATIQSIQLNSSTEVMKITKLKVTSSNEILALNENLQQTAATQELDIRKLKSQLAHKNQEINSQELNQWKSQSATLIFFIGTLIFALLYIRSKLTNDPSELATFNRFYTQKKWH